MKIAVVLDQYYTHDGGAFTFQGELLRALELVAPESQHQFIVLSPTDLQIESVSNLSWQRYSKPGLMERLLRKLFRYAPSVESSLGWRSGLERQARGAGAEIAWFLSPRISALQMPFVPLVLDLQHRLQPQFPEVSAGGEWQTRESHYRRCLPQARFIVAGTQAGRDEIVRFYNVAPEKIALLPHPTPQAALESLVHDDGQVLADFGLQPGYLLYPAQLWVHKNHANLLLALAELKKAGLTLQLVLTGSDFGAWRSIQKLIKLHGLEKQVKFLDYVSRDDLYALYRNALALTYMSFFGPENLPPLEAFALGCPVIAARVSGAEEQLSAAALLVNPTDPMEIANAVHTLHSDESQRKRLVAAGHERAKAWTTWDFVRGALRIFDDIERAGA
ncbi:MAG: glycosyltransferase family 4 protein [Anaerolineales bacterium]|nr:MAG: glycosyltransferase family 4 protein [Anaerolineales bacterium]